MNHDSITPDPPARLSAVLIVLLALSLGGCPRSPDAPEPPAGTPPCEQLTDCNPGVSCGALRLCVDGYCEAEHSLLRPCSDVGAPVRPPGP